VLVGAGCVAVGAGFVAVGAGFVLVGAGCVAVGAGFVAVGAGCVLVGTRVAVGNSGSPSEARLVSNLGSSQDAPLQTQSAIRSRASA